MMDGCHGGAPADLGYRFRLSDAQFAHEAERLAKKIPLVSNPAMELLHAAVHFLPNTTKRALSLSLKVTDLVCEGASEVLQRVATSVPLRMFKMAYLHSRKGTGWKPRSRRRTCARPSSCSENPRRRPTRPSSLFATVYR